MSQAVGDELGGHGVEHVGFLELHAVELSAQVRVRDAVQAVVLVAHLQETLPVFPETLQKHS